MPGRFRYDLIPPGSRVLCALSGGMDSMYLLCRLLEGAQRGGYEVRAAHYNHCLRPAAGRDEAFVWDWCRQREVPLAVGCGDVAEAARREGLGLEACARRLRYEFLEGAADELGCDLIATAHHAGDNAETVLMNLIRGCGLRGLTGIPERRGRIIRPMLTLTRDEVERYLKEHGVPHVEDESNADPAYTRNRLRREVLPLLEQLNPRAVEHITQTAARLAQDERELATQSARLTVQARKTSRGLAIPAGVLAQAPRPIALRAAGELLRRTGLGDRADFREGTLALAVGTDPSGELNVTGGRVYRAYGELVFSPKMADPVLEERPLGEGDNPWGEWAVSVRETVCPPKAYLHPGEFYLKPGTYVIRPRRPGDGLRLGPRPWKTIKKLMMEQHVPQRERSAVPVLDLDGRAAAAGGLGPDEAALARPGERCLRITIRKGE